MSTTRTRFDGTAVPDTTPATARTHAGPAIQQAVEKLTTLFHGVAGGNGLFGLATGLQQFDINLGGLCASELIVLAGRPSAGKSALALNIVEHVAVELKRAVAVFCPETTSAQLSERLLCCRAKIDVERLRHGCVGAEDLERLRTAGEDLAPAPIYLDDTPALLIRELRATARKLHHTVAGGLGLIVVDCLELLCADTERALANRYVELSDIAAGLKSLARELDVPVLVLAHLNRNPEARPGGRAYLSDLRDSGSIEDTADVVLLLHRAGAKPDEDEGSKSETESRAELNIAKQRNGSTGEVKLSFQKYHCRFTERD